MELKEAALNYRAEVTKRLTSQGVSQEKMNIIFKMIGKFHSYALNKGACKWSDLTALTDLCLRAPDLLVSLHKAYGDDGIIRFLSFAIKFKVFIPRLVELENDLKGVDK